MHYKSRCQINLTRNMSRNELVFADLDETYQDFMKHGDKSKVLLLENER